MPPIFHYSRLKHFRPRIVTKVIYCLHYCFLLTKDCMHDEVWGCVETLEDFFFNQRMLFNDFVTETVRCQYVLTLLPENQNMNIKSSRKQSP